MVAGMIYCKTCCYTATRPDTFFDKSGVCSGCLSFAERKNIDWSKRLEALKQHIADARAHGGPYDCVVPVSGGKDSTYQVIKMLELGARVLCVHAATDYPSEIGRRNLKNLARFAKVIEVKPDVWIRKRLIRIGLEMIGDLSYPEHMAIWAIPTRVAHEMNIPMVVWGEQPQREYATPEGVAPAERLNAAWVNEYGGMLGLRLGDLAAGKYHLSLDDTKEYQFPAEADLLAIWLGDYIEWDGWKNFFIAQHHGFECLPHLVETSSANFENLDNHITVLRDWLRFLKYGYSRSTDIICNQIRRGRLTREEGFALIKPRERFPQTSLGMPIKKVLSYAGISIREFVEHCDAWTNQEIFKFENGKPVKEADGTPVMK